MFMKCAENRNFTDKIKMQEKLNVRERWLVFSLYVLNRIKATDSINKIILS
jgi:hypothetical protein